MQNGEELKNELRTLGARLKEVEVVRFPHIYTLREEFKHYESRIPSDTWSVLEGIFQASLAEELCIWAERELGDFDQERQETSRFVFDVASFDGM